MNRDKEPLQVIWINGGSLEEAYRIATTSSLQQYQEYLDKHQRIVRKETELIVENNCGKDE